MANAFTCKIEKQLETETQMPAIYKRYVDDTLSAMLNVKTASELTTLNNTHPSNDFSMEPGRKLQASFSRHENNQKWVPPRHESA